VWTARRFELARLPITVRTQFERIEYQFSHPPSIFFCYSALLRRLLSTFVHRRAPCLCNCRNLLVAVSWPCRYSFQLKFVLRTVCFLVTDVIRARYFLSLPHPPPADHRRLKLVYVHAFPPSVYLSCDAPLV